ncbi:metallophosphoesterase [Xiashengella succiniciproducens]|jgi:predicted MPP superfamily phosphohydrolase|uniref:Metallophosphoesterase n=1 Tax=Xiashengella succiniciproducens TaxID=2949635 RepID=A0A9J6ZSM1_9BACT|nr:metallophosphoesterase [Alkaliflexus sp. Ai-910]URW80653.1 metallophosphoesterase [Alkaliflexus sp. Ai-910]
MPLFFIIVLSVHALVNFYIGIRGWQALEFYPALRPWFVFLIVIAFLAYPAGRILEKFWYHPIPISLHWFGAFWFAVMLYATLLLLFVDLARIVNLFVPFVGKLSGGNIPALKLAVFGIVSMITIFTVGLGHINAWTPKIVRLDLVIPKQAGQMEYLRIVAASDIHMGTIIGKRRTEKLVNTVNSLNPDIILFAGDIVDEDVGPVIKQNLGASLLQLHAPYGVYACTGNHEYIGGGEKPIAYLEGHGIKVLRDTALLINNSFYVVGREDLHKRFASGQARKSLDELLSDADKSRPLILLDHQPQNLHEAEIAGIDLQLSGHTHYGQLWPLGYVTDRIFELSRGYLQKGNTHYYVSTGFGTWGPPVRTGNRPEILVINLYFKQ